MTEVFPLWLVELSVSNDSTSATTNPKKNKKTKEQDRFKQIKLHNYTTTKKILQ